MIPLLLFYMLHPFYLSLTQMDYNPRNHSFEVSIKVFTDDLEACMSQQYAEKLYIHHLTKESPATDSLIEHYLRRHVNVEIGGKTLTYRFWGKEQDGESTWLYIECLDIRKKELIQVSNTILTECFEAQSNIVHISIGQQTKSLILSQKTPKGTVQF